jgi:RNA polymerase sigma-54 factor
MALSASLQMRQSQSLVMTPQLMQSIRLLQFSHVELNRFIEQEAERNPLLELVTPESEANSDGANGEGNDASRAPHKNRNPTRLLQRVARRLTVSGLPPGDIHAERLNDEIDGRYENVFPDDHGVERPSAPEFVDNWKSMPGNDGGRVVRAMISMILQPARRPCAITLPSRSPSPLPIRPNG